MGGVRLKILSISIPFPVFILELWRVVVVVVIIIFRLMLLIPKSLQAIDDYLFENYTPPSNLLLFLMGASCAIIIFAIFVIDSPNFEWVQAPSGRYYYVERKFQQLSPNVKIKIIKRGIIEDHGIKWVERAIVVTEDEK